jgi:hypothetical protein
MKRRRISQTLLAALLASAVAGAAPAVGISGRAAPAALNGVYSVTFNLQIRSTLPAGTTIICRARIAPNPDGFGLGNSQLAAIPAETFSGLASVNGSTATCATEIPFSWTMANAPGGVVLSYEIDAVGNAMTAPMLLKSSTRQGIGAALPAPGGSANLSFNLLF